MRISTLVLGLFLSFNLISSTSFGFGRFVGTLTHDRLNQEQLAKLDFIVSREEGNSLTLDAVLTLHFGDFKSGEYTTYHFKGVRFNVLTGSLVFDEASQPLSIITTKFSNDTGVFEGDVRSIWAGNVGKIVLKRDGVAAPQRPLIEPVWGEYKGSCKGQRETLQLYTSKSSQDLGHLGEPFAAYNIAGQLGVIDDIPVGCVNGNGCNRATYQSGSYDFFSQQLRLIGFAKDTTCTVTSMGMVCDGCTYTRVSNETAGPRQLKPPSSPEAFPKLATSIPVQSGEYRGYVHHEYLNAFQYGSVNLAFFPVGEAGHGALKISASSKLYFGDERSREVIPYRYAERSYPNPLIANQVLLLENAEADVDSVIQITSAEDGVIRGVWYSLIFGRVGTFEFRRTGLPALPSDAYVLKPLSGNYENTDWDMDIRTALGVKPSVSTSNPYFPNILSGGMRIKGGVTKRLRIVDGSYDFYVGRIGISREFTAGGDAQWVGTVTRNHFFLNSTRVAFSAVLPDHTPKPFRRIPE